ncbi:hypothetical protein [Mycolicibacterium palauense]|nr:hypothetical protein [Mycolicibacterium palauense]
MPVKRIVRGPDPQQAAAPGAVDHPEALSWFGAWAAGAGLAR